MDLKQAKARFQQFLTERSTTQKFATAGLALSFVMFFNYPTLLEALVWTGGFTGLMTLTGYCLNRFGVKGLLVFPVILVPVIFMLSAHGCLLGLPHYFPEENMFTGESRHGQWDGFRVKHCDKGRMPWYYRDLPPEEKNMLCNTQRWNETLYCIE